MKIRVLILTGAWAWMAWAAGALAQSAGSVPTVPQATTQPSGAAAPYVQAIRQAADPSAVVSAYAAGFVADRADPRLHEAYIERMVEFGMPEMAYHQAELAASLDPRNGLVKAVLAYVNAKRGLIPKAMSQAVEAASLLPDHLFVQRTSGELLAWYDRNFLNVRLTDSLKASLDSTRKAMSSRAAFAQSYDQAKTALGAEAAPNVAAPGDQQAAAPPTPISAPAVALEPATQPAAPEYSSPVVYVSTYAAPPPSNYYEPIYYADYYPPGWNSWWWWPQGTFSGSVFVSSGSVCFFSRHHHHDNHFIDGDGLGGRHGAHFASASGGQGHGSHAMTAAHEGFGGASGREGRIFGTGPSQGRSATAGNLVTGRSGEVARAATGGPGLTVLGRGATVGSSGGTRVSQVAGGPGVHVFSPGPISAGAGGAAPFRPGPVFAAPSGGGSAMVHPAFTGGGGFRSAPAFSGGGGFHSAPAFAGGGGFHSAPAFSGGGGFRGGFSAGGGGSHGGGGGGHR